MRCRALPCGVMLCGAVACCTVLRAVLYLRFCACQVSFGIIQRCRGIRHIRFVSLYDSSSAQLIYSSAARNAAPCGAVRCRALPCGAVQRSAVRCRAGPCPAVRYGTVRCCAVLCRAACCAALALSYMPGLFRRSIIQQYRGTRHQGCTCYIVESRSMLPAQLSSAISQQREAQRRAVPCCRALPRGALPCCAVLSFEQRYRAKYRYRYVLVF